MSECICDRKDCCCVSRCVGDHCDCAKDAKIAALTSDLSTLRAEVEASRAVVEAAKKEPALRYRDANGAPLMPMLLAALSALSKASVSPAPQTTEGK